MLVTFPQSAQRAPPARCLLSGRDRALQQGIAQHQAVEGARHAARGVRREQTAGAGPPAPQRLDGVALAERLAPLEEELAATKSRYESARDAAATEKFASIQMPGFWSHRESSVQCSGFSVQ